MSDMGDLGFWIFLTVCIVLMYLEERDEKQHEIDKKLSVINLLGGEVDEKRLELWLSDEDEEYGSKIMEQFNIREDDFLVGVNPESFQELKLWFEDTYKGIALFYVSLWCINKR